MTIRSAAFLKDEFEAGTTVTSTMMGDLIDSTMRDSLMAISSAAEGGKTGVLMVTSALGVSAQSGGAVGLQILSTETTASLSNILPASSASNWALIQTVEVSGSATIIDMNDGIAGLTEYERYVIVASRIKNETGGRFGFRIQASDNSGSTFANSFLTHQMAQIYGTTATFIENENSFDIPPGFPSGAIWNAVSAAVSGDWTGDHVITLGATDIGTATASNIWFAYGIGVLNGVDGQGSGFVISARLARRPNAFRFSVLGNRIAIGGRISLYGVPNT